jgi:uncharacterized protein with NAD-binding domain and iron-sulfur cluster
VAILGGGMGALTTAFELSEGNWREQFERITVYQRGWRLGGKGASSRGAHGRIEEHGLHVLLGYYDQTFDVMRRCYDELDRERADPSAPIRTWDDAVAPSNLVGVVDAHDGHWEPWVASFSPVVGRPGAGTRGADRAARPMPSAPASPLAMADLVVRSLRLLIDFFASLPVPDTGGGTIAFSTSPMAPARRGADPAASLAAVVQGAALIGVTLPLNWAQRVVDQVGAWTGSREMASALPSLIAPVRRGLRSTLRAQPAARRSYDLVELVTANLVGIAVDGLLTNPEGFGSINHLDYREWLFGHGIDPDALASPILRGMYDLVFGYENGDPTRPRFSAGLGLELATNMLLGYSGALFWKMQAGMGEVIFAPLYEVLRDRGVEFSFFHRVDALHLSEDGRSIASIDLGVQAEVADGPEAYEPLVPVKGLPCWPDAPLSAQLGSADPLRSVDLESFWSPRRDVGRRTLVAGEDFDAVVFGISLGMVPHVCGELLVSSAVWRAMVDNVGTVATQALQLWLSEDDAALGWSGPAGVTVSGFVKPFDTWASMPHLLPAEDWPDTQAPRTIAYFCSVLDNPAATDTAPDVAEARRDVHERARTFLDRHVATLWPDAVQEGAFRWALLCDGTAATSAATNGPERLETQYWRANIDPSDRYVQSLPGSDQYRLQPGKSGFDNLVVAGDWTDNGLNAGCVEGATRSGRLAAAAVRVQLGGTDRMGEA